MGAVLWSFTRADAHEETTGTTTMQGTPADLPLFTLNELAHFDGKSGRPAYVAVEGVVYDLTKSPLWKEGAHYGYKAGQDLTDALKKAPHSADVLKGFPVVGQLVGTTPTKPTTSIRAATTIFGLTLARFSAYLALLFFILNFATCYAMPWSKFFLPWKGKWPGKDSFDPKGHLHLLNIHKPFAWGFLLFSGAHAVLAILHGFGIVI